MTRLVLRCYTFACNWPGCESVVANLTGDGEENSARAAWRQAVAEGWSQGPSEDEHFCPHHGL